MSYDSMGGNELMILYQKGDLDAFDHLYSKYKGMVYGYLCKRVDNRSDVDEIFQNTFLRLHHSRTRFKGEFPFEPWLFAVVRNSLVDYFRIKKKDYNTVSIDTVTVPASAIQTEDVHEPGQLLPEKIKLNIKQRQAIELRYGKDISLEEIASSLNTSPSNARQLVSRALKKLRKIINPRELI